MPSSSGRRILVTNDDGVHSEGLLALAEALESLGPVTVVAPLQEMSAVSHSISLFRPIRYEAVAPDRYGVDGTPVDAVILAVNHLLSQKPSLVVSGINKGSNLGQNIFYSGTVGAAVEGTLHGIPSIAVSICSKQDLRFDIASAFAAKLAAWVLEEGLPPGVTLNANIPVDWSNGVRLTRCAHRSTRQLHLENPDSQDPGSYWINERIDWAKLSADSDYAAIRDGHISITPLAFECADAPSLGSLEQWVRSFQSLPAR